MLSKYAVPFLLFVAVAQSLFVMPVERGQARGEERSDNQERRRQFDRSSAQDPFFSGFLESARERWRRSQQDSRDASPPDSPPPASVAPVGDSRPPSAAISTTETVKVSQAVNLVPPSDDAGAMISSAAVMGPLQGGVYARGRDLDGLGQWLAILAGAVGLLGAALFSGLYEDAGKKIDRRAQSFGKSMSVHARLFTRN